MKNEINKLNKPLYFYHLVSKDVDTSKGLLSLKYMYEHELFDLFDVNVSKYKERIINYWNIERYKNKTDLSREEYIDALNIFRGKLGASYIYFFKFPPYKELGNNMQKILENKDIYRININDEKVRNHIIDIFYGYHMSNSDNKILDKSYYENVTKNEYFKNYNDNQEPIFATLNHIGIVFKDDYCPRDLIEKVIL